MPHPRPARWFKSARFLILIFVFVTLRTPAGGATVELLNGDKLRGRIVEDVGWAIMLDHPTLGRTPLPRSLIERIDYQEVEPGTRPGPADDATAADSQTEQAEAEQALEHPGVDFGPYTLLEGWDRHLEVGLTGSEGNTQTFSLNVGFEADFENETKRWNIDAAYFRTTDDGDQTRDEGYLEVTRDWLLPESRYFLYAAGRYDSDEFEDWDHRFSGGAGFGYEFIDQEDVTLLGRFGLGGRYEIGGSDGDEFTPEGQVGFKLKWQLTDTQEVNAKNTFYPSLADVGQFRNITKLGYEIAVSETDNLALKLGIQNEYQSDPDGEVKRNDLKYFASLVWDF